MDRMDRDRKGIMWWELMMGMDWFEGVEIKDLGCLCWTRVAWSVVAIAKDQLLYQRSLSLSPLFQAAYKIQKSLMLSSFPPFNLHPLTFLFLLFCHPSSCHQL